MDNVAETKQKANALRKSGQFEEALPLYRSLWQESGDRFDGTGLLHCLRKLDQFDEALPLADDLITKYADFEWCRNEVIWTLIEGRLGKLPEEESAEKVVEKADSIMRLNPDGLAAKLVVFRVLKSAKSSNNWEIVNDWVTRIDPASLSTSPMMDDSGKEGWSDQALWYNYRISGLLKKGPSDEEVREAIGKIDEALERFPRQRKLFLRLKGMACHMLGDLPGSEGIYQSLCAGPKPDWWLLHEYARVVRDSQRLDEALKLMYRAANSHSRLEVMVTLFQEIGILCKEMHRNEEARDHLVLCKHVRAREGWSVSQSLLENVRTLNGMTGMSNEPSSLDQALNACRKHWRELLDSRGMPRDIQGADDRARRGLVGRVNLGRNDRLFCFIDVKGQESFFCLKRDLPRDTADGNEVAFDAIPSFDKKKNRESWKACNVRHMDRPANERA